jgi:phosphoribosyl 1,2-cyclic phosphate phosphodiesterase
MEVLFLGTCAYDYSPLLETTYKDAFDKDARRSSCALINGRYLIDCGDHCLEELRIAKIDLAKITDIFVTHFHRDHYNVKCISQIAQTGERTLRVWVRAGANVIGITNVEWKLMQEGVQYDVGENTKITGLPANHDEKAFPQQILLEVDGKKLFYALDGAWFPHKTYYSLKKEKLDMLILDCTCGDYLGDYRIFEHNCIPMLRILMPSLKTLDVITDNTKIYLSHIAPSLHKPHKEIEESVRGDGWIVAYDGLSVVV